VYIGVSTPITAVGCAVDFNGNMFGKYRT